MSAFMARFGGRCPGCDERIRPGDLVEYVGAELMHEDCAEDGPSDRVAAAAFRRERPACPRCHLVHAGECL